MRLRSERNFLDMRLRSNRNSLDRNNVVGRREGRHASGEAEILMLADLF